MQGPKGARLDPVVPIEVLIAGFFGDLPRYPARVHQVHDDSQRQVQVLGRLEARQFGHEALRVEARQTGGGGPRDEDPSGGTVWRAFAADHSGREDVGG